MTDQELRATVEGAIDYDRVKAILGSLARQESPETPLWEAEPKVLAFIRDYIRPRLIAMGMTNVATDEMGNLLASLGAAHSGRSLLFLCHAMNHAPESMADPYSGAVVDGTPYGLAGECVWGRGVCEQKGAMAAMVAALEAIGRRAPPLAGQLLFGVSTAGECGRHDSVMHMVRKAGMRAEIAVLGLGTQNQVGLGNKGRFNLLVTVTGTAAHVSSPWLGVNAIDGAIEVVRRVKSILVTGHHPELGPPTITVQGFVAEPFNTSTVPSRCRLSVDRRVLPGDDLDAAIADTKARIGTLDGYGLEMEVGTFQYPAEIARTATSARLLAEATSGMLGEPARHTYIHGALDAGYLQREGIETVQYGPGDLRFAHTATEIVSVREVYDAARVLMFAALRYLA